MFTADQIRAMVEAAYREGVSHGESSATAYEWGGRGDSHHTWEHSDAKEAMEAAIAKAGAA